MWTHLSPEQRDALRAELPTATAVYEEAGRVIAGGTWHVLPDGRVARLFAAGGIELSILTRAVLDQADRYRRVDTARATA